jgi:hypothetical protein
MSLDPSGSWLLCSCKDKYLYLLPVLALVLVRRTSKKHLEKQE